jgi:hypothetical protein
MKTILFLLLALSAQASEHDDIVKAMKKPKLKNEVMTKSSKAITVPLNLLIPDELRKEIDKEKVKPSPTPHSSLFDRISDNYYKKAYAFAPAPKPIPMPTFVSLKSNDTPIINQWNGTCTAHASMAAAENILKGKLNLSERHHWDYYKQYSSHASVASFQNQAVTTQENWPNNIEAKPSTLPLKAKLKQVEYIGTDFEKLKSHLAKGLPSIVAMAAPNDLMSCLPVVREASGIAPNAGHAMAVVGYGLDNSLRGKGYFIVKNSWGSNCHAQGYASIPFSACQEPGGYCIFWNFKEIEVLN